MRFNYIAIALSLTVSTFDAQASLVSFTSNGVDLVYSSINNVTWMADANLLGTMISDQGYNNVVNAIIAASPTIHDTPNYYDGAKNNADGANYRSYSGVYTISFGDFNSYELGVTVGSEQKPSQSILIA